MSSKVAPEPKPTPSEQQNPAKGKKKKYKHALSDQPFPHGKTVLNTPDSVEHVELFHTNRQGLKLCMQRWRAKEMEEPPVGCVVCLHGLNTHAGYTFASCPEYSYKGSAIESWVNRGFVVYCPDHQGHGKSERLPGIHGNVRSFDDIAHDQKLILRDVVRKDYPIGGLRAGATATSPKNTVRDTVPAFLYGHCMGGAHVLRALQLKPDLVEGGFAGGLETDEEEKARSKNDDNPQYAGIILSAPTWRLAEENKPSDCIMGLLGCLAGCIPKMIVANWPDAPDGKFEDYNEMDMRFYADPWCDSSPFSAQYAHQINLIYQALEKSGNSVQGPVLLIQGDKDAYVPSTDTDLLWEDIKYTKDRTYVAFQGIAHGLMYEPGCEQIFDCIGEWMEVRANQRPLPRPKAPITEPVPISVGGRFTIALNLKKDKKGAPAAVSTEEGEGAEALKVVEIDHDNNHDMQADRGGKDSASRPEHGQRAVEAEGDSNRQSQDETSAHPVQQSRDPVDAKSSSEI